MVDCENMDHPVSTLPAEIFLVYGSLRTGGIETLIVRMANFFVASGLRVSIFCGSGGELEASLNQQVKLIYYNASIDLVHAVASYHSKSGLEFKVLLLSFDPISAARALMVETALSRNMQITHLSGVFHPRAYFMTGERRDRVFLNYLIARAVGSSSLFFMNEECRKSHESKWGVDLANSPILALPIKLENVIWQDSGNVEVRVVSVGRLVNFKAYNLGAAGVVRACIDQGVKVTWDIYGEGSLEDLIKKEIDVQGVGDQVRLMGKLDYSRFSATIVKYDLFVGMGTAALEAAMLGVPTICATVDQATCCYGYLDQLPFGNVGEMLPKLPDLEMSELIKEYSEMKQAQRSELSRRSRGAVEKYGMPKFSEELSVLISRVHAKPSRFTKWFTAGLYRFFTESCFAKTVRGFKSKKIIDPA